MLICRDLSRLQLQLAWCGTVLLESHYDLPLLASLRAASNMAGSIEYFGDLETAAQDWFWFAIQFRTIEKQQWKTTHSKTLGSNLAKTTEKTSTNQTHMSLARDGNSQPALFFFSGPSPLIYVLACSLIYGSARSFVFCMFWRQCSCFLSVHVCVIVSLRSLT